MMNREILNAIKEQNDIPKQYRCQKCRCYVSPLENQEGYICLTCADEVLSKRNKRRASK